MEPEEDWKSPKGTIEDAGQSHWKHPKAQKNKENKTGENRGDYDQEIPQEKKIANKARKTLQENHQRKNDNNAERTGRERESTAHSLGKLK